ncbi:DUF4185 domain-containing protein [soil metagenome]
MRLIATLILICSLLAFPRAAHAHLPAFGIHVIDRETRRGVPLIELKTTNETRYYTDSGGWIAYDEPGLIDGEVYFSVSGDGYEVAPDGFGNRGVRLNTSSGGRATIEVTRTMAAECLYRVTGEGIYRDSVLLGELAPTAKPLLNGRVMGQDSVQAIVYRDRLLWCWGDTGRPEYPLGNFASSGAWSALPSKGGLKPSVGVDLNYFVDDKRFSRGMVNIPGEGVKWIDGFMTLEDPAGKERLLAKCDRMKSLGEHLGRSMIIYDDATDLFREEKTWPMDAPLAPLGQPFRYKTPDGIEYFYFPTPYPIVRVRAEWGAVHDPAQYEGFTCLTAGSKYDKEHPALDRDAAGKLLWSWKKNTEAPNAQQQGELISAKHIAADEAWIKTADADTSKPVLLWGGSVCWNSYRQRFVMIAQQMWGTPAALGEIWYAESEVPEGPWPIARKIATHQHHTLYNPVQHPFFDEDGGRVIYFEGTYSTLFADKAVPTPRYDYNQMMYRLDLSKMAR